MSKFAETIILIQENVRIQESALMEGPLISFRCEMNWTIG